MRCGPRARIGSYVLDACTSTSTVSTFHHGGHPFRYAIGAPPIARHEAAIESLAVVLVVATVPVGTSEVTESSHHRLVAAAWRAVEPLVHAPEPVQPAHVSRVRVVDDVVVGRERAHAWRFSRDRSRVRAVNGPR